MSSPARATPALEETNVLCELLNCLRILFRAAVLLLLLLLYHYLVADWQ